MAHGWDANEESSSSSETSSTENPPTFLPPRNLPGTMAEHFANWQSRFHLVGRNVVPDSMIPDHEEERKEQDDWNRLMSESSPMSQKSLHAYPSHDSFSSQPPGTTDPQHCNSVLDGSYAVEGIRPIVGEPSTKRRPSKLPPKRGKKSKIPINLNDDEEDEDNHNMSRWTNSEVSQLISFRSEMDLQFKNNAKKQGINTWEKLQVRMVAACDNFGKSAEACRKKWKAVYNQYCTDKRLLQISGEGRKISCKFFDQVDEGFNNAANVRKYVHDDSDGSPNPCPPDLNEPGQNEENGTPAKGAYSTSVDKDGSPGFSKPKGKMQGLQMSGFLADMVDCSRNMVTQTTRIADDIHNNSGVLKELQLNMCRILDKL